MVASEQLLYQTIVLPRKHATQSIHNYPFCNCPLMGIQFEVLRITWLGILVKKSILITTVNKETSS